MSRIFGLLRYLLLGMLCSKVFPAMADLSWESAYPAFLVIAIAILSLVSDEFIRRNAFERGGNFATSRYSKYLTDMLEKTSENTEE